MARLVLCLSSVLLLVGSAQAQQGPMPQSILLYELQQHRLPQSHVDLDLCRLLARATPSAPFRAIPADREPLACDRRDVHLASGGWCTAGIVDAAPHFSQALMPIIDVVRSTDGVVVYANHFWKQGVPRTPEGEAAAVAFLQRLPRSFDTRGETLEIFPEEWLSCIPLTAGCDHSLDLGQARRCVAAVRQGAAGTPRWEQRALCAEAAL